MRTRTRLAAATLAGLMLTAAACGSSSDDSSEEGAPTTSGDTTCEQPSGTITMGTYSPPPGLDPKVMSGGVIGGGTETAAIYDRLMRYDPETGEFQPHLAESLTPDDTFTTWTLQLRPDVTFSNGDPLNADAVKFSIERLQAEDNRTQSRVSVLTIESVEVVDDLTAEFTLTNPWPGFPTVLSDEGGMVVNPAVVEALGPQAFAANPVGGGAGPYEVERFVPSEEVVLTARTDYWGGTPCVETLRFVPVPAAQAAYESFQTGELQMALLRDPRVIAEAEDAGVETYVNLQNAGESLVINQNDPASPLTDVRVRQAVAHAIDQEALDQRVNEGTGFPSSGIIGGDAGVFTTTEGPAYDPALATQLVDEAKAAGFDGRVSLICDADRADQTLAVAAQLEAAGFDVDTDITLTIGQLIERVRVSKDFQLACWGFNFDAATTWVRLLAAVGQGNALGYQSDAMNAALLDLQAAESADDLQAAAEGVQEVWNEEVPAVILFATPEAIIFAPEVEGVVMTSKTIPLFYSAKLG
jgi:peptide/nickel transport system substrate-binding protein